MFLARLVEPRPRCVVAGVVIPANRVGMRGMEEAEGAVDLVRVGAILAAEEPEVVVLLMVRRAGIMLVVVTVVAVAEVWILPVLIRMEVAVEPAALVIEFWRGMHPDWELAL